jgi:predicted nucleic acid-binding protein
VIYILDANAMIALLRKEPGVEVVESLLLETENTCFAHAINLCELYYDFARAVGELAAQEAVQTVLDAGVIPSEELDMAFWQEAGRYKAAYRRVALADCFCIALTRRLGGELVTGDHREFDPLVPLGLCPIRFFR